MKDDRWMQFQLTQEQRRALLEYEHDHFFGIKEENDSSFYGGSTGMLLKDNALTWAVGMIRSARQFEGAMSEKDEVQCVVDEVLVQLTDLTLADEFDTDHWDMRCCQP